MTHDAGRSLRIAWLGAGPSAGDAREAGGVPGVATELLYGLARLGHRIDCFTPGARSVLPARLAEQQNLSFIASANNWQWGRWYSRTNISAFVSGQVSRVFASLALRRELMRRHRREPYDVVYHFSNIEAFGVPTRITRAVPLVIHPETHMAGELRFLLYERRLSFRAQPRHVFAIAVAVSAVRALVQRVRIRRARLLVCISRVFRDHLVRDYGFPPRCTVVIPNPVRIERFEPSARALGEPPTVLVLGRVAARKGIEDVVAVAQALAQARADVRLRVVGGPGLSSDYTKLLEDLPADTAEYVGRISARDIPAELARTDVLLQASKYEPFALTVGEALAAGAAVVATSEVGAIEDVDRTVASEVQPGDVPGMVAAILAMLDRLEGDPVQLRARARAEAERLFAPDLVCAQIAAALEQLAGGGHAAGDPQAPPAKASPQLT